MKKCSKCSKKEGKVVEKPLASFNKDNNLINRHRDYATDFVEYCKQFDIQISVPNWGSNFPMAKRN